MHYSNEYCNDTSDSLSKSLSVLSIKEENTKRARSGKGAHLKGNQGKKNFKSGQRPKLANKANKSTYGTAFKLNKWKGETRCYGEFKCEKCNTYWATSYCWENGYHLCEHCSSKVYPYELSILTLYEGEDRCYGEFECEKCNIFWYSGNSYANCYQKCRRCSSKVYPYYQRELNLWYGTGRCFGEFECHKCYKYWASGNSWADTYQKCKECSIEVYPYEQRELEGDGTEKEDRKPHPMDLCQRCLRLKRPCFWEN